MLTESHMIDGDGDGVDMSYGNVTGGKEVKCLHPIAFASKQTSMSEEKYKPFLLEFAALKFAFDKFSDIVYGYPMKVRTDCQALRDVLMNDKLSAMHARWQDSMLAHNIIDVQHVPGVTNIADGLSHQYEDTPRLDRDSVRECLAQLKESHWKT